MTMRTARSHSCSSRVAASPVDPQATMKSMPASTCQFTSAHSAGSSIDPSARKGVTIAVPQPVVSITEKCISLGGGLGCDRKDKGKGIREEGLWRPIFGFQDRHQVEIAPVVIAAGGFAHDALILETEALI